MNAGFFPSLTMVKGKGKKHPSTPLWKLAACLLIAVT